MYVLDANILIQAKNHYYGFDIAPGFWDALEDFVSTSAIITIDKVRDEILEGNDDLAQWMERLPVSCFGSTEDAAVMSEYRRVMAQARNAGQYTADALMKFADDADSWIIAFALAKDAQIVTHEDFRPEARNRVLIPNICRPLGSHEINTYDFLRVQNVKLIQEVTA